MVHCFDVKVAEVCGVNSAIILYNLNFWIKKNEADEKYYFKGSYWTYGSKKTLSKLFPYFTDRQVRTALDKLKEAGLIIVDCFNKNPYDRTNWYAITEKGEALLNGQLDSLETEDSNCLESPENEECGETRREDSNSLKSPRDSKIGTFNADRMDEKVQAIQDINKNINKKININNNYKEKCEKEKSDFFDDEELNEAFKEFLQMRNKIKKPLATKQALTRMKNKIEKLSGGNTQLAIKIINQSTDHCWQDVFELKSEYDGWRSKGEGYGRQADGGTKQDSKEPEDEWDGEWLPEWDSLGRW